MKITDKKKWVTVADGIWRIYKNKDIKPGFVLHPRYASDLDFMARVQVRAAIRQDRQRKGRK